jgi:hypothetical protein
MVEATNSALSVKLHEPYYSIDHDTSMIDLLGDPTSDDVRRWVQNILNKLSGRKNKELEKLWATGPPGKWKHLTQCFVAQPSTND